MKSAAGFLLGFALIAALPALVTADPGTPTMSAGASSVPAERETGEGSGDGTLPTYLRDRGTGIRTSMFGTFVRPRELLVYTFFEYYLDNNTQYTPSEFGYPGNQDFEGRYRASEGLVFLSYGFTDRLAIEMEAAVITASFRKAPNDPSTMPTEVQQSGLGDVEGQLTWRWLKETPNQPELFCVGEVVFPHAGEKALVGTSDWEVKIGTGALRGFGFGTVSARIAIEYARASESPWDLGEWGFDYIRQAAPSWRIYAGVEGQALDELALITEVQRTLNRHVTLKIGTGIGLLPNTTDFAPEVGILFTFPTGDHSP